MNKVEISSLIGRVYIIKPIKVSKGSRYFNNRNDEEPKPKINKYAIKVKSGTIKK